MASLVEWCAGVGSALASLLIFWWSTIDNFANPIFRLTAWVSRIVFYFSPYLQLTISEYGAERFERSEFFLAVEAYLSEACADRARKLTAEIGRDRKNVRVYVDDHEEVADTYRGATIWWRASKKKPTSVISFIPGEETRQYHVVFHRRHRDLVICDYLPYVLNEGRSASIQNRPRRLFTNKPSSRWRPYDAKNASWSHVAFQHPATFDTLAMDPDEKEDIIDELTVFRESQDYYSKVGKAWKRGYLLYGPPGTGKSTMIAAMANFLDYDIYDLELTVVKNNTELRKLFIETTSRSIIVIEDIDCSVDLTGKRNDKKKKKKKPDDDPTLLPVEAETEEESTKLTLSGVLNFIDGLWSACGGERIIIFTTNNKNKLDPALIRRGRMDRHIEMSYCSFEAFKLLAKNFLDVEEHEFQELFGEIRRLLEQTDVCPADVAENLMPMSSRKNKRDPDTCLKGLVEALKKANAEAATNKALDEHVDVDVDVDAAVKPKEEEEGRHRREAEHGKVDGARIDRPVQMQTRHAMTTTMETLPSLVRRDSKEWVLDTSSLIHYTFNLRLLHDLTTHHDLRDDVAHDHELPAVLERGSVKTERFKVPDVHYIQGDVRNVISIAQLARSHGLVTIFEPTCAYVRDGATGQEVGRAHLSNGIYVLDYLLIRQLHKKGGVQVEGKGEAGGSHGGGSGLRRVGDDERKGSGGGSGGTTGQGQDGGKDGKVEELQQIGMFGQPRPNRCRAKEEASPQEQVDGTRTAAFYVVSGAQHHITWNGDVLRRYHGALQIKPPIESVIVTGSLNNNSTTVEPQPAKVDGIGYIDSIGGSLDHVLFVPDSIVNLISISQLTEDSSVRVVFKEDEFWIEKLQTDERIGFGRLVGTGYVVARLDVGAACDWILDTFAPFHYTPHRRLLYIHPEEEASDLPPAARAAAAAVMDELQLQVVGHGSVETERYKIPNVHHTASADNEESNVISVAQLVKKHGLVTVFEPTCCHVKDKETGRIVGRGRLRRGVYVMDYLLIGQQYKLEEEVGGSVHSDASGKDKGKRHEGGSGDGGEGRKGGSGSGGGGHGSSGEKSRHVGGREGGRKEGEKEKEQQRQGDEGEDREGEEEDREGGEGEGQEGEGDEGEEEGGEGEEEKKEIEEGKIEKGEGTTHFLFGQSQDDMDIDGSLLLPAAFPRPRRNNEARKSEFILASNAARYHVTWNGSVLFPYPLRLRDSSRPPIRSFVGAIHTGVGPITVMDSGYLNGDNIMLDGVLLAPDSQMNLVSVVQLAMQYGVRVEMHEDIRIIKELGNGEQVQFGGGYMNESWQSVLEFFQPQPALLYAHSPDHNHYFYHENFFAPHQR